MRAVVAYQPWLKGERPTTFLLMSSLRTQERHRTETRGVSGCLHGVDTALDLVAATPTSGALLLAGLRAAGARHASDREKARGTQRMRRQPGRRKDRGDVFARYLRERIELQSGAIFLDHGDIDAQAPLE